MGLLLLIGVILLMAGGSSSNTNGSGMWTPPDRKGLRDILDLSRRAGLSELQAQFLAFVAKNESGWNNLRGLGIPERFPAGTIPTKNAGNAGRNEARAAAAAFRQNRGRFAGCPWPEEDYGFGSGGWFAMLPAYGLAQLPKGKLRCLPPSAVFDPIASICMAIGFARGLQGYRQFTAVPTVLNLRGMWGWPARGGDPERLRRIRSFYVNQARSMGLPDGWVDQQIPRFPHLDLAEVYARLGGQ